MPRGGYRPNSGPKKGAKYKKKSQNDSQSSVTTLTLPPLPENYITPLDYMLRVLNDANATQERRDKMAALAAPFCHSRTDVKLGKKEEKAAAAKEASVGRFAPMKAPRPVKG